MSTNSTENLALDFEDAERPATTRTPKANPYDAAVKALKGNADESGVSKTAKAVTLPADAVASHVVLMQKAGRANGVTVRNNQRATDGDKVRVTFWTVPAITRRDPAEVAAEKAAKEAEQKAKAEKKTAAKK